MLLLVSVAKPEGDAAAAIGPIAGDDTVRQDQCAVTIKDAIADIGTSIAVGNGYPGNSDTAVRDEHHSAGPAAIKDSAPRTAPPDSKQVFVVEG